jgi:iron complex outermembrane receptor protein
MHQFFFAYATELSAPRTDNLYNGGFVGGVFSSFATVAPETSATYDLGYRYHGDDFHASVTLWNTQFKNRIVSTFDPAQGISIDHNIGPVNMDGLDLEAGYNVDEDFNLYGTVSYMKSRVINNLPISALVTLPTAGKQFVETPNYMATARATYNIWGFRLGIDGKFVGSRFATEVNDYKVPSYFTANADITYDLDSFGWDQSYIKFNVSNIFDEKYFSSVATSRSCFTPVAPTTAGCTSYPLLAVGSPRTLQVTLRTVF